MDPTVSFFQLSDDSRQVDGGGGSLSSKPQSCARRQPHADGVSSPPLLRLLSDSSDLVPLDGPCAPFHGSTTGVLTESGKTASAAPTKPYKNTTPGDMRDNQRKRKELSTRVDVRSVMAGLSSQFFSSISSEGHWKQYCPSDHTVSPKAPQSEFAEAQDGGEEEVRSTTVQMLCAVAPADIGNVPDARKTPSSPLNYSTAASTAVTNTAANPIKEDHASSNAPSVIKQKGGSSNAVANSAANAHIAPVSILKQTTGTANTSTSSATTVEFSRGSGRVHSTGASRNKLPAPAASRILFLHDAEDNASHGYQKPIPYSGVSANNGDINAYCFLGSQASRVDGVSGRSPPDVSFGTVVPNSIRNEFHLLKLLTRTDLKDFTGALSDEENEVVGVDDAPPPNIWPQTKSNTLRKGCSINAIPVTALVASCTSGEGEGWGKRCAVRRLSRTPSFLRCAARSDSDVPSGRRGDEEKDERSDMFMVSLKNSNEDSGKILRQLEQQQLQLGHDTLMSSSEAHHLYIPSLAFNTSVVSPTRSQRDVLACREVSSPIPRNLFSDMHTCAAELPESDTLSIAAAVVTVTDGICNNTCSGNSASSSSERLDTISFRTPLSPCPSSVAPPFSVFPCAATSRVTSPVSIPAKMMKQRQREHARVRNGPASVAPQISTYNGNNKGGGSAFGTHSHPFSSGNVASGPHSGSQLAQRELLGSFTMTSLTTGSLPSAFAPAPELASREVMECRPFCEQSGQQMLDVEWRGDDSTSCLYDNAPESELDERAEGGRGIRYCCPGRSTTFLSIYRVDQQPENDAGTCLPMRSPATGTEGESITASLEVQCTKAAGSTATGPALTSTTEQQQSALRRATVSLRICIPTSGSSTPPTLSPRVTPHSALFPYTSPLVDHRAENRSLQINSLSSLEVSMRAATTAADTSMRQSCCASPWSPTSAKCVHTANTATTLVTPNAKVSMAQAFARTSNVSEGGGVGGVNAAWSSRVGTHAPLSGARCCSLPLPPVLMSATESDSCFSLLSNIRDSGARTPLSEQREDVLKQQHSYHQRQQQQRQTSESRSFTPRMSSGDASRRSCRSAYSSPVFTGTEQKRQASIAFVEQSNSLNRYVGIDVPNSTSTAGVAATTAAAGEPAETGKGFYNTSVQHTHLRLQQDSSVEYEPLSFISRHARHRTPPPGLLLSTCSTPPQASLLLSRTSQSTPRALLPPPPASPKPEFVSSGQLHSAKLSPAEGTALTGAIGRQGGASPTMDRGKRPHEPVVGVSQSCPVYPSKAMAPLTTSCASCTSRKSRNTLPSPPWRGLRASPSPFPRISSSGSPSKPAEAAAASPLSKKGCSPLRSPSAHPPLPTANTALMTDVTDAVCYGVESELYGLQSSISPSASQLLATLSLSEPAPLVVEEKKRVVELPDARQLSQETNALVNTWSSSRATDSPYNTNRKLSHGRSGCCYRTDTINNVDEQCCDAEAPTDVENEDVHDTVVTRARDNERIYIEGNRVCRHIVNHARNVARNNISDIVSGFGRGSSTCFASSLQLVPPPPLVTLPRSPSTATSMSSLHSPTASPVGRPSCRGSPPRFAEPRNSSGGSHRAIVTAPVTNSSLLERELYERSLGAAWREEVPKGQPVTSTTTTPKARLPASAFHYAFSSLRGSRNRQEDSVTLIPDLPIRGAVTQPECQRHQKAEQDRGTPFAAKVPERGVATSRVEDGGAAIPNLQTAAAAQPVVFTCFGVFDGHCGDTVSNLAAQYFPEHFEFAVKEYWAQWANEKHRAAAAAAAPPKRQRSSPMGKKSHLPNDGSSADEKIYETCETAEVPKEEVAAAATSPEEFQRMISAALVQSLVHLDLTLYDALHQKTNGRSATQRRDAGSTASVATFFRIPHSTSTPNGASNDRSSWSKLVVEDSPQRRESRDSQWKENLRDDPSTASITLDLEDTYRLCIANLGDSRAIIGNKHTRQLLLATTDHRISACPSEEARIAAAGGVVELGRVDGSLDVTRGLGDYRYKVGPAQWWASATRTTAATSAPLSAVELTPATVAAGTILTPVRSSFPSGAMPDLTTMATAGLLLTTTATTAATSMMVPSATETKSASTSMVMGDETPHTEVPSAVRALRWQSRSTTPVRDSLDDGKAYEGPSLLKRKAATVTFVEGEEEPLVNGEENRGDVLNEVSAENALMQIEEGECWQQCNNNTKESDEDFVPGRATDQWRRSMLSTSSSSAASTTPNIAVRAQRKHRTERELFSRNASSATGATTASSSFVSDKTPQDFPHSSRSPLSTSTPGSPLQFSATLTGNAVSNIADVYEWEVHRDDVLIIASDGVWDTMTSEEVLNFVCSELQSLETDGEDEENDEKTAEASRPARHTQDPHTGKTDGARSSVEATRVSASLSSASSMSSFGKIAFAASSAAVAAPPNTGTPIPAPADDPLQRTPLCQPTTVCHGKALCTPCGYGGGCCYAEGTPGGGSGGGAVHGSSSRSSAVQAAARRLTEYVVNTLSGNDNTTAIVVVFQ